MKNIPIYIILVFAVAVLGWSIVNTEQSSQIANTAENFQYYQTQNEQSGNECGDLTNLRNVQHLSHHPDRFAECIKRVDSNVFEQAVGKKKDNYMKFNGIQ